MSCRDVLPGLLIQYDLIPQAFACTATLYVDYLTAYPSVIQGLSAIDVSTASHSSRPRPHAPHSQYAVRVITLAVSFIKARTGLGNSAPPASVALCP